LSFKHKVDQLGGEKKARISATNKFIAQYPLCCFCSDRPAVTREHMPPGALFDGAHRPDKLVMPACKECNAGTSTADLLVAIVSRWIAPPNNSDHARLASRLRRQAPEIIAEFNRNRGFAANLRARKHLKSQGVPVPDDAKAVTLGPLSLRQLKLFACKATLALFFEHFKRPFPLGGAYVASWRSKEDVLAHGLPQGVLDLLPIFATLAQGKWDTRDTFAYRHNLRDDPAIFGFIAQFRGGLFFHGFAVEDASLVASDPGWRSHQGLLTLLDDPEFAKRRDD
jgi:hypothetical protein